MQIFAWMLAENSDFQSEMKDNYLNNTFPWMEAPTFSGGASLFGLKQEIFDNIDNKKCLRNL
jgi:hypothetical protein